MTEWRPVVGYEGLYRITHCKRGHPFDAENTAHARSRKKRICRQCERDRNRARRAAQRSEASA